MLILVSQKINERDIRHEELFLFVFATFCQCMTWVRYLLAEERQTSRYEEYSITVNNCELHFWDIIFQPFQLLSLAKDHWRGFNTRNAHLVYIVN